MVAAQLRGARTFLRDQLRRLFAPELARPGRRRCRPSTSCCSFESYELLRDDQRLSTAKAAAALVAALTALLDPRRSHVKVLRTPDERFAELPDFPFEPHYVEIGRRDPRALPRRGTGRRRARAADARRAVVVATSTGTMIPVLVAAGHRCVAPDLVGFGRSDKPTEQADYTYERHVDWMREVAVRPARPARHHVLRPGLGRARSGCGSSPPSTRPLRPRRRRQHRPAHRRPAADRGVPRVAELRRRRRRLPDRPDRRRRLRAPTLATEVVAAYDAPFPDDTYKAGARQLPGARADLARRPGRRRQRRRRGRCCGAFDKPFLCAFSDSDPITKGGERAFLGQVPGAEGQPHTTIEGGGHFLQEDRGAELRRRSIVDFIARAT